MIHRVTYYIYDIVTDLPVCIADTATEAAKFIGCCRAMVYKMNKENVSYNGYGVVIFTDNTDFYG